MAHDCELTVEERVELVRAIASLLSRRARGFRNRHLLLAMAAQLNRIAVDELKYDEARKPAVAPVPPDDRSELGEALLADKARRPLKLAMG